MSETQESRKGSTESFEPSDGELSLTASTPDSFDPFQYVARWSKELSLPCDLDEDAEQDAEIGIFLENQKSPEFLERQTREREELKEAKKRLAIAEILRREGHLMESLLFCGPILRQEIAKWTRPVKYDDYGTVLLRECIMQVLRIFCQGSSHVLIRYCEDCYPINHKRFLAEVLEGIWNTQNVALLCVFRDIYGYLLIRHYGFELQDTLKNILDLMQPIYLLDDPETLLALKYLAESFVFDGYRGRSPEDSSLYEKREVYIRYHSRQLRKELGPFHPGCLRFDHAMARVLLSHSKQQAGKEVLRDIFDRRVTAYGEVHLESQNFIDGLLDEYCENYEGEPSDRYRDFSDCAVIDNLIKFCMKRKAYEELETVVQECVFPMEKTDRASEDKLFMKWDFFENDPIPKVQPRLASHQTPGWGWYWEDSRMYTCTWNQVTLLPDYPEDPFPRAPIRLSVTTEAIQIDISGVCAKDFLSIPDPGFKSDPMAVVRNSEIWQLLESKRLSGDWKILLALSMQDHYCTELIRPDVNHVFWLFWDEVIRNREAESTKGDGSRPGGKYSRTYRFLNLDNTKPEWLVLSSVGSSVIIAQENMDPHEPIPGDPDGHYVEKNIKSSILFGEEARKSELKRTLRYSIDEQKENLISVNVPYEPYEHFRTLRAYREGLSYAEYFEYVQDFASVDVEPSKTKERWCKSKLSGRPKLSTWPPIDSIVPDCRVREGFFNNIPTGRCAIVSNGFPGNGFNMISSDWLDWKTFTLHKANAQSTPSLQLPSGHPISCQGYITGTWTEDGQLSKQWSGLSFFVMDCEFSQPGSNERCDFIISSTMLAEQNLHLMSGPEKRFFCGRLSLSFFRYAPTAPRFGAAIWKKKQKKGIKTTPVATIEDSFWGEMNRREKWDRDFERRFKVGPLHPEDVFDFAKEKELKQKWLADMEAEKETEEQARKQWDARNASTKQKPVG